MVIPCAAPSPSMMNGIHAVLQDKLHAMAMLMAVS
jgi:hypothetical protein